MKKLLRCFVALTCKKTFVDVVHSMDIDSKRVRKSVKVLVMTQFRLSSVEYIVSAGFYTGGSEVDPVNIIKHFTYTSIT